MTRVGLCHRIPVYCVHNAVRQLSVIRDFLALTIDQSHSIQKDDHFHALSIGMQSALYQLSPSGNEQFKYIYCGKFQGAYQVLEADIEEYKRDLVCPNWWENGIIIKQC